MTQQNPNQIYINGYFTPSSTGSTAGIMSNDIDAQYLRQSPQTTENNNPNTMGIISTPVAMETEVLVPETLESTLFVPGFLGTQIGKLMRVEFLIGNNTLDRVGVLRKVGASYIILQPFGESTSVMCDLFSIKFVTIINTPLDGNMVVVP